jgi:hypothetical protein
VFPTFGGIAVSMRYRDFMNRYSYIAVFLTILLMGCDLGADDKFEIFTQTFDFDESDHGWQGGFSDFPYQPDDSAFYELRYEYGQFNNIRSIMLSGNNHSDDLFMFIKKKLTGLEPNRQYTVTFEVELASSAVESTSGVNNSLGESVYLKVGATSIEPKSVIENNMHVMNIDKGAQAESGADMVSVGDIAAPTSADGYYLVTLNLDYTYPIIATTNSRGELWLIVGTDSGYEGVNTVFYTRVSAVLSVAK